LTEQRLAEQDRQRSFDQMRALAGRVESVREEERTRAAREIHDELGQALTAIRIDFSSLLRELTAEQRQHEKAASILNLLDRAIKSVRRISTELRPGILDDLGLPAAIEWAAEEFQSRTGIECGLTLPKIDLRLDPECATALFRIFQETLTNVARHAHATHVDVHLAEGPAGLMLEVRDNGRGATPEQLAAPASLGIRGMRERALLLSGELLVRGRAGHGTIVTVRLPKTTDHPK
jgi:signal transduction histidine kinase